MHSNGKFGPYGGVFVPQILYPALEQLEQVYLEALECPDFQQELSTLLRDFAGRPTPLHEVKNLTLGTQTRLFLKREDLVHGGAHKTNQALAQGLLAKRMGKKRLIAETGAGQHGIATAMVGALLGMQVTVYMGAHDVERQKLNVQRMTLMGAKVIPVDAGEGTLKYAINEALRDWAAHYDNTHYLIGSAVGPHPFPTLVKTFQKIIGVETRKQILEQTGQLPDAVIACVNGGSNALGIFSAFLEDTSTSLVAVEPGGRGDSLGEHGATLECGQTGILHGARTQVLQTTQGQISETHSIAAGLDYPAVGPEIAHLYKQGRLTLAKAYDDEVLDAFQALCQSEGILPALESCHALAYALKHMQRPVSQTLIVNLSGRGDKDLNQPRVQALGDLL